MASKAIANAKWPWDLPLDPRLKGYPFVGNYTALNVVLFSYCFIVLSLGPRWMASRQPYRITGLIKAYNFINIFVNLFFAVQFSRYSYFGGGYSFFCQGMTYSRDENAMMIVKLGYYYCIARTCDFLDTFFFILRKKFNQITVLHWTHHANVVWSGWLYLAHGCDGHVILGVIINSIIHVIMYTYYFLAACGPRMRPYLWWKRYITNLQIAQFVFLLVHISIPLFYDCGYPRGLIRLPFVQGSVGLILFVDFYVNAYLRKASDKNATIDSNLDRQHSEENKKEIAPMNRLDEDSDEFSDVTGPRVENVRRLITSHIHAKTA